jgi:two-component system LytT family sensor kinase
VAVAQSLTFQKLRWTFLACGLAWAGLQAYIIYGFGFGWFTALTDSATSAILLAAACWLINNNLRYYQPGKGSYVNLFIWCVALAGICTLGCRYLLPFINPIRCLLISSQQSLTIRFFTDFLAIGWMAMISLLWYSQLDQKKRETQNRGRAIGPRCRAL